jgi:hypothetical protein
LPATLEFLRRGHPIYRVSPDLLSRLIGAQQNLPARRYRSAADLCEAACKQTSVDSRLCASLRGKALFPFADLPRKDIVSTLIPTAEPLALSQTAVVLVADRIQLLRAFENPDAVVEMVRTKVEAVVMGFPRKAADLERGRNPGDLLDPYITAATQDLMYSGSVEGAIGATVSHKAMMMIEGLVGHLHEDVIGAFRGNVRVPEPRGEDQENLDPLNNPFPGADVVQPPWDSSSPLRFHQVKSKMGSAKGGDARRLGQQLKLLADRYEAEIFYEALIGKTLAGHRSMAGVLREEPRAIILVGQTAFKALTGSPVGAELLLRVYQSAFRDVARATGYNVQTIAAAITTEFRTRSAGAGDDFLQVLTTGVTYGDPKHQDSRTYPLRSRRGRYKV